MVVARDMPNIPCWKTRTISRSSTMLQPDMTPMQTKGSFGEPSMRMNAIITLRRMVGTVPQK